MRINDAFSSFIRQKRLQNCTEKTISNYIGIVSKFSAIFSTDCDISALTLEQVEDYLLILHARGLSPATIGCYTRHIKAFLAYAEKKYGLAFSASEIKVPKSKPGTYYIYGTEEIALIFEKAALSEPWITARNYAVIALMLDSGLRQSEVCGLLWDWVDFDKCQMKVYGKGRKERIVPLGQMSARLLKEYRALCPFDGTAYVFSERRGGQLTNNTVKLFVQKLKRRLPFPFYSHLLRHNFATNWCLDQYEAKGHIDIYALKAILGHEDIKTTSRYLHYAEALLATRHSISHLDKVFPDNKKHRPHDYRHKNSA